jgi:membrane protein implicated in regulation of membrane protease activity
VAPQARQASARTRRLRQPDVNLDVGETLHIEVWNADGTANVKYRGANWTVVPAEGAPQTAGAYRVSEVIGSRLVVEKI